MDGRGRGKSKDKKITLPYQAKLHSAYHKHELKVAFEKAFKERKHLEHESRAVIYDEPFQCCLMPEFVKDPQFLEGLKEELLDQIFWEKNNDLYKFQQTDDLKKISTPHVKLIKKLLYEDLVDWLTEVTGISFTNTVDLTCSRYDYTDVLLCHDDELDTRRIAFILYLVPPWSAEDGGTLDLFNMDEFGQPKEVVRSLVPTWNTLAWFEVTEASHHQVSEILSSDKTRLSINGWFHATPVPRPARHIEAPVPLYPHVLTQENVMSEWMNPIYLDPDVQGQIQEKFEADSEIELQGFLREEKYQAVVEALRSDSMHWQHRGPPNKRCYGQAVVSESPQILRECLDFLRSEEMFLTLSNLTGLTLHQLTVGNNSDSESEMDSCEDTTPDGSTAQQDTEATSTNEELNPTGEAAVSKPKKIKIDDSKQDLKEEESKNKEAREVNPMCHSEVRRWQQGDYTLLHDTDSSQAKYSLDAMLYCDCKGWSTNCGGYTSYITKGHDEELLSVSPAENSLALVYRDQDTLRFVKHVNSKVTDLNNGPSFYDFHLVYYE